jgi:hypothetical protein
MDFYILLVAEYFVVVVGSWTMLEVDHQKWESSVA